MSDAARVSVGLMLVTVVAPFVPGIGHRRLWAFFLAAALSIWTVYPLDARLGPSVTAVVVVAVVAYLAGRVRQTDRARLGRSHVLLLTPIGVLFAAALATDAGAVGATLGDAARSDRLLFFTLGLLAALFPAGELISAVTRQWSDAIEARMKLADEIVPRGLDGAGRYIGWLERTFIYAASSDTSKSWRSS